MHDCPCCGEAVYTACDEDLCSCCEHAGCEPRESDGIYDTCEVPTCPDCDTPATYCTDGRWHSNCEDPCENIEKAWGEG